MKAVRQMKAGSAFIKSLARVQSISHYICSAVYVAAMAWGAISPGSVSTIKQQTTQIKLSEQKR